MDLFSPDESDNTSKTSEERLPIATCVVLLEMARSDEEFSDSEREQIVSSLTKRFSLSNEDAHELIEVATASRKDSVDLWSFTSQINQACTMEEKIVITEEVWRVIFADGSLDGHEDFLVHKLRKLFNMTHKMLIDAKVRVLDESRGKK